MENTEVVFSYTDKEAVEDGVLIPLTDKDRVTVAVFQHLQGATERELPKGWPLPPSLAATYPYTQHKPQWRAIALSTGLVQHYGQKATEIYENGGVWSASLEDDYTLRPGEGPRSLWILPNELGGVTLMFPEDY